jgi:uncharacterized repeat protein (TIGR03803 family)
VIFGPDGSLFDQAGNLYGTTAHGGADGYGTVYQLTPSGSGWTESVLFSFDGNGAGPTAGLVFDNVGNLYGTTWGSAGGGYGTVYQLTPSGSGWTESVLFSFGGPPRQVPTAGRVFDNLGICEGGNDGCFPYAGLIFDPSGNLYGATTYGPGSGGGGTAFELTPSGGSWTFSVVYSFTGSGGGGPAGNLVMDGAGNLYGTTGGDGAYGYGCRCHSWVPCASPLKLVWIESKRKNRPVTGRSMNEM